LFYYQKQTNTKNPAVARKSRPYRISFSIVTDSELGHISHRFQHMAIYSLKLFIENCGQFTPLQMETWSLLTVYRKLPAPHGTIADLLRLTV